MFFFSQDVDTVEHGRLCGTSLNRGGWNPSRERSRAVDCLWEFCMEMFSPSKR